MNQRLNATTPTALLACAVANIANKVGGYKDGFPAQSAYELLSNLFNADQDTDDFVQAFNQLKSIWDRAEGASTVIDQLGYHALDVQIDLEENVIYLNGKDTRQELADTLAGYAKLMDEANAALIYARDGLATIAAERDKFRDMVLAAANGEQPQPAEQQPGGADPLPEHLRLHPERHQQWFGSAPVEEASVNAGGGEMPTIADVETMIREQFGIPDDVNLTVLKLGGDAGIEPSFVEGLKKTAGIS